MTETPVKPPRFRLPFILGSVGIGVIACCGLIAVIAVFAPATPPTPTAVAVQAVAEPSIAPTQGATVTPAPPMATPAPTAIPEPTNTPRPSSTPRPTNTPRPVPTVVPTSAADADIAGYLLAIQPPITRISEGLGEMSAALSDTANYGTDAWIFKLAAAVVQIEMNHDQLAAMTPPTAAAEAHALLIDATGDCKDSGNLTLQAIDARSPDMLREATALQESCIAKLPGVTAALTALRN